MSGAELAELARVDTERSSLLDAVDRLIDKGAMLKGDLLISIADVDLIRVNLDVLLAAVETLEQADVRRGRPLAVVPAPDARGGPPLSPPRPAPGEGGRDEPLSRRRDEDEPDAGGTRALASAPPLSPTLPPPARGSGEARPAGPRVALDPKAAEKGVARLVLTLVEFVRRLLERQAIRRMEGGLLPDHAVDRMGETLARLEEKVGELKRAFDLEREDLDIDLGPLGRLNGPGGSR